LKFNYLQSLRTHLAEALIVDPELPGIISREDYEKAGVEELAEWKSRLKM